MLALHIGSERTTIGDGALALGWASLAQARLKHQPPTPLEIEEAIAAIEDEIAAARPPRAAHLVARDAMLREIAVEAGASTVLARDAVEQAFERSLRRPPDNERMAALLILRELMHHLGIETIELGSTSASGPA